MSACITCCDRVGFHTVRYPPPHTPICSCRQPHHAHELRAQGPLIAGAWPQHAKTQRLDAIVLLNEKGFMYDILEACCVQGFCLVGWSFHWVQ
jgi:hypothetical protein